MPEKKTIKRAQKDKREGKSPSTQAGEFVKEEMDHIREGKHGARNAKQAIAIGLSKARRSGVDIPTPKGKSSSEKKHTGKIAASKTSKVRSEAGKERMKKESSKSASHNVLSMAAKRTAQKRTAAKRHQIAMKAARTRKRNEEKKAA